MTVWHRLGTLALVLVTTAGATFMVFIAPGSGALEAQPVRVFYDLLAAAILLPWLGVAIFRPAWRPSSRLLPAILVLLIAFAVSSVTSRVPRLSFEMLGYAILLAELYLLLVTLMRQPAIRAHLERLALLLTLIASVLYVIQVAQAWIEWWGLLGRVTVPPLRPGYLGLWFGSPNPVATLVLVLGAFGLAAKPSNGRRGWIAAAIIAGLVALAVLLTGSRGAWLGAAAGVVAVVAAVLVSQPTVRTQTRAMLRSRLGAVSLAVAVPVLLIAGALAALSGRLTLEDGGIRAVFGRASLAMFESAPLTGVGPGVWGVLRAANTPTSDADYYIPHAHNLYLQTVAEFGILGVFAALVLVVAVGSLIVRAIRSDDQSGRAVGYAAVFVLVLSAIQQLADILVNVPALLLAVALPFAWLDANAPLAADIARKPRPLSRWARVGPVVAVAATVITLAVLLQIERAAELAGQGGQEARRGAWTEADLLFVEANDLDPNLSVYQFQLGVSAANAGDFLRAERYLQASAEADDYAYAWLDLAGVRWRLGDLTAARDSLARAERLGLQRIPIIIASGWLHQQLGDRSAAIDRYAAAVLQSPTLASDPFWSSEAVEGGTLDAIIEAVDGSRDPETRLKINLVLDRTEQAQSDISALLARDEELYTHLIEAWHGERASWDALEQAAASRPFDSARLSWCRFVAAHLGDVASVDKYSRWLVITGVPDSAPVFFGRISIGEPEPIPPSFLDRYGSIYRRELFESQVVGFLPQVGWSSTTSAP